MNPDQCVWDRLFSAWRQDDQRSRWHESTKNCRNLGAGPARRRLSEAIRNSPDFRQDNTPAKTSWPLTADLIQAQLAT
jgi:hypothetical protein